MQLGGGGSEPTEARCVRGRMFSHAQAKRALQQARKGGGREGEVLRVTIRRRKAFAPPGLNTVQLLRVASAALGLSPHRAMEIAEKLYMGGLISYPRTESSRYPPSFDLTAVVRDHSAHPHWGGTAQRILEERTPVRVPRGGVDAGDHPPITPMRCVGPGRLPPKQWRLYEFVARHFLASLMPPLQYTESVCTIRVGGPSACTRSTPCAPLSLVCSPRGWRGPF